jgi:hypothetical protein
VAVPPESRPALARAADDDADPSRLRLDVDGVEVDEDPGVVYEVYLNLPGDPAAAEPEESHFVGHVTFFGAKRQPAGAAEGHVHGGVRHTFDITPVVAGLRARGGWNEDQVQVSFVPLGLLPPPGYEPEEATARAAAEPQPTARIGRVSIVRE